MSLFSVIDWLFDKNSLTEQKLPKYRGLYGPKKEFDNLLLKEFHHTELYCNEFLQDEDYSEIALNKLIAVIYRKPKPFYNKKQDVDGDIRRPFNENLTEFYTGKIAIWPLAVKLVILFWYEGCRQHIKELYEPVFSGSKESHEPGAPGMFDCIWEIARDGKYGDFDKVENLNIHTSQRRSSTKFFSH